MPLPPAAQAREALMKQVLKGFLARREGDLPAPSTDILLTQRSTIACHRITRNYAAEDYFKYNILSSNTGKRWYSLVNLCPLADNGLPEAMGQYRVETAVSATSDHDGAPSAHARAAAPSSTPRIRGSAARAARRPSAIPSAARWKSN